jgi:hypothetical protein
MLMDGIERITTINLSNDKRTRVQKGDASRGLTEQHQVRGGQEWGLRRRNVGPGGEQVRKGEELAVKGQQYKAGWEGCQE